MDMVLDQALAMPVMPAGRDRGRMRKPEKHCIVDIVGAFVRVSYPD